MGRKAIVFSGCIIVVLGLFAAISFGPLSFINRVISLMQSYSVRIGTTRLQVLDNSSIPLQVSSVENRKKALNIILENAPSLQEKEVLLIEISDLPQKNASVWKTDNGNQEYFSYSTNTYDEFGKKKVVLSIRFNTQLMKEYGWSDERLKIYMNFMILKLLIDKDNDTKENIDYLLSLINEGAIFIERVDAL